MEYFERLFFIFLQIQQVKPITTLGHGFYALLPHPLSPSPYGGEGGERGRGLSCTIGRQTKKKLVCGWP